MPPILIIHGDADKLVPIYQSADFVKRCEAVGSPAKLIAREGKCTAGRAWTRTWNSLPIGLTSICAGSSRQS